MADLTLAVAGHAPNSQANIEALLSDWLRLGAPDREGYYSRPPRFKQITVYALLTDGEVPPGLLPALNLLPFVDDTRFEVVTDRVTGDVARWAKTADGVHTSTDPASTLLDLLSEARSPRLLINWDDTDADDEALVQAAHESGKIRVLDLVEGLVEIVPDDPEEEEAQEEAPPEPARPARRKKPEVLEEVVEELDEEEPPAAKRPARVEPLPHDRTEADTAPEAPVQTTLPTADAFAIKRELVERVYGALVLAADYHHYDDCMRAILAGKAVEKPESGPLTAELTTSAELLRTILFGEVPYEQAVTATATQKPTGKPYKVIWDEDEKEWRKAGRGRVRTGTRVGMMDSQGNVTESS